MIVPFHRPRQRMCPECGVSVENEGHECDVERRVDYQMLLARGELANLDEEVAAYLRSPRGHFELWWAARERRCRESS
jgi:hypothetical protein